MKRCAWLCETPPEGLSRCMNCRISSGWWRRKTRNARREPEGALLLRSAVRGRAREHFAAIGESDDSGIGHIRSILGPRTRHHDLVPGLQRFPRPAIANQNIGAG